METHPCEGRLGSPVNLGYPSVVLVLDVRFLRQSKRDRKQREVEGRGRGSGREEREGAGTAFVGAHSKGQLLS